MTTQETTKDKPGKPPKQWTIHIDKQEFKVEGEFITGAQLRALPEPDIGPDRDLYLEAKGHGEDRLIEATDKVELEGGLHFFTAPAAISPGHAA